MLGFVPCVDDAFFFIFVEADLDGDVGVGVTVVEVAAFFFGEEFDEDFFIHPGFGEGVGVIFFVALEFGVFLLVLVGGRFGEEVLEVFNDQFRVVFHALDVEGNFGADGVFGVLILWGGVDVGVVFGAAMAAGDDDFFVGFVLEVVEEVDEDGVDEFFFVLEGEAMFF